MIYRLSTSLYESEIYRLSVLPRTFSKLSTIVIALGQKGLLCPSLSANHFCRQHFSLIQRLLPSYIPPISKHDQFAKSSPPPIPPISKMVNFAKSPPNAQHRFAPLIPLSAFFNDSTSKLASLLSTLPLNAERQAVNLRIIPILKSLILPNDQ